MGCNHHPICWAEWAAGSDRNHGAAGGCVSNNLMRALSYDLHANQLLLPLAKG